VPVRPRHPVVDACEVAAGGEAAAVRSGSYEYGSRCVGHCHPHGSGLWTGRSDPQREGGRVGAPSRGWDVRVPEMSARGQRRGHDRITRADRPLPTMRGVRRADAVAALSTRSDAQVDAIAHPRWPPRRGRCRLEMACPTGIYSTPAEACLLTTRIRILLLPVVQATGRCACGAAEPDTRNQPKKSSTLSVGRTEPDPHRIRDAEPGARVT